MTKSSGGGQGSYITNLLQRKEQYLLLWTLHFRLNDKKDYNERQ